MTFMISPKRISAARIIRRIGLFVLIGGLLRAGEHYLLYEMHPTMSVHEDATVNASLLSVSDAHQVVRLYEASKVAVISMTSGLLVLLALTMFTGYLRRAVVYQLPFVHSLAGESGSGSLEDNSNE